jgi:hypothetical protein
VDVVGIVNLDGDGTWHAARALTLTAAVSLSTVDERAARSPSPSPSKSTFTSSTTFRAWWREHAGPLSN